MVKQKASDKAGGIKVKSDPKAMRVKIYNTLQKAYGVAYSSLNVEETRQLKRIIKLAAVSAGVSYYLGEEL